MAESFESIQSESDVSGYQAKKIAIRLFRLAKAQLVAVHEPLHAIVVEQGDRKVS